MGNLKGQQNMSSLSAFDCQGSQFTAVKLKITSEVYGHIIDMKEEVMQN